MVPQETVDKAWKQIEKAVLADIKKHLTNNYSDQILKKYGIKIKGLVTKYLAQLPAHVTRSEGDDLMNVARIEFFETIKQWDPDRYQDVWPLAYSRITGAMKDHIRYLTKADPSRLYDWITAATNLYSIINSHLNDFEARVDNGVTLSHAMECLSTREKKIIVDRYKSDKTFKEIGDEIGISESQVTRIYKISIKKLKRTVKD
jgi:RNA polymerase sigma factor (sigma-70 family)